MAGPRRVVDTVSEFVYVVEDLLTGKRTVAPASRLRQYAEGQLEMTADLQAQIAYDEHGLCVERITAWCSRDAGIQLRVHWLGFEDGEATWEPLSDMFGDVPDIVRDFVTSRRGARAAVLRAALVELSGGGQ